MADRNTKFSKLKAMLEAQGLSVVQAKGSEMRVKNSKTARFGKHGANPEIAKQVIYGLRKKFRLLPTDGVSDRDFYGDKR